MIEVPARRQTADGVINFIKHDPNHHQLVAIISACKSAEINSNRREAVILINVPQRIATGCLLVGTRTRMD